MSTQAICPDCGGSGEYHCHNHPKCDLCRGTGTVGAEAADAFRREQTARQNRLAHIAQAVPLSFVALPAALVREAAKLVDERAGECEFLNYAPTHGEHCRSIATRLRHYLDHAEGKT